MPDLTTGRAIYAALKKHLGTEAPEQSILYIEAPEDIEDQWQVFKVTDGEVVALDGPLHSLITQGQGTVVFHWGSGRFDANQIARYLSVNDDPQPMFASTRVSPALKIINLVSPNTAMGNRFNSRCQPFIWPTQVPWPKAPRLIPNEKTPAISEHKDSEPDGDEQWLLADLPEDPERCKEALLGTIDLNPSGNYVHVPGLIQQALEAKQTGLRFISAPWHNPEFQRLLLDLRLNQQVMLNGVEQPLPKGFRFERASVPGTQPLLSTTIAPQDWKPDHEHYDIFLLNSSNFDDLEKAFVLQEDQIHPVPGWLQSPAPKPGQRKQLVLTEPLSPQQKRQLLPWLEKHKEVEWVDLTSIIPAKTSVIPARMQGPSLQDAKLSHPCDLDPGILARTTFPRGVGLLSKVRIRILWPSNFVPQVG